MEVRIGKYIIKGDSMCFWIEQVSERKKGENVGKECSKRVSGYCGDMSHLFESFAKHKLRGEGVSEVKDFLKLAAETSEELNQLARELGKALDKKRGAYAK